MNNFDKLFDSMFKPEITPEICEAVKATWNHLTPGTGIVDDNESAIEQCICHLKTFGYRNEEQALDNLIREFGYSIVLKALDKKVRIM